MTLSPHPHSGIWRQFLSQGHPVFMLNPQGQSKQPSAPTFVWFLASVLDSFSSLITELFWSACRCHVLFWLSLVTSPAPATRALGQGRASRLCSVEEEHTTGISKAPHSALVPATGFARQCWASHETSYFPICGNRRKKIILCLPAQTFKLKLGHGYEQSTKQNIYVVYIYIYINCCIHKNKTVGSLDV